MQQTSAGVSGTADSELSVSFSMDHTVVLTILQPVQSASI